MDINTSKVPYQYGSNYGFGIYSCGGRFDLTVTADSWWDEGSYPGGTHSNHPEGTRWWMSPNSGEAGVYNVTVIVKPYSPQYDGTIRFTEYSEEPIDPPYSVLGTYGIRYRQWKDSYLASSVSHNATTMSFTRSERSHTFDVTSTGGHWFVYALTPDYEITNYEGDVSKTVTVSLKSGATPAASTTLYIGKPNGKSDRVTLLFEDIGEEPTPEPTPEPVKRLQHTRIICGESPIKHYIPTGITQPFTLSISPDSVSSESIVDLYVKYGVSEDYSHFWIKTGYEPGYNSLNAKLRATFEDGNYQDISIISPEDIADCYLSAKGYKSWGYIIDDSTPLKIVCNSSHTNSTTYPWINISGDNVTLTSNTDTIPRCGDIFVEYDDTLYVFTILQRPKEQSDYFLASNQQYVSPSGATRTVSVLSRSGKPIKRWWVYLDGAVQEFHYGTGDDVSFSVTIPASEKENSVYGALAVEDNDGKMWSSYGSTAWLFHQYSNDVTDLIYQSLKDPSPYQSFVAFLVEKEFSPFFENSSNHFEKYSLSSTTENGFKIIDISVYPFGCNLYVSSYSVSKLLWFHSSDYFDVPVRLVEVPYNQTKASLPVTLHSGDDTQITTMRTTNLTYSLATQTLTIQKNTSAEPYNGMIYFKYANDYRQGVLIPVVQGKYESSPEPEDLILKAGVLGETFAIGPYEADSWYVSGWPNWIHPSVDSGTGKIILDLTVDENISMTPRNGGVTIVYNGSSAMSITINQDPIIAEWKSRLFAYAGNSGGDYSNDLTYNLKPDSIEFNNSDPWFEITSTHIYDDEAFVSIRIPSAGGSLTKNGSILATLQYGDKEIQVGADVFQYGDNYTVDPSTAVISSEGGSVVVTVESDYTLNDYTSVTGVTAGTYNMERLSSNKIQITFDFEQNYGSPISMTPKLESSAYGTNPIPLTTITQDTFDFTWDFPTTPIYLDNKPSTFKIEFTSNTEIENIIISNVPDWLTFTRNGNTITGVASKNTGETRSVTLTFTADGFGVSKQLEVTQDALVWTLDTTSLLFDCTSGTPENPTSNPISETVTYSSSTPISNITAYIQYLSGNDWLTVDCNGNIVVTATDNRLGNYRNAIITLYPDDYSISQQIYVSQYGSSFEWDTTTALIDTTGGQVTFTYTAIDGYLLLSDITVDNAELSWSFNGGYNGSITFTVPMNTGIARVFNPKVYAGNRLIGEFTITQEDTDITVDTPEIIAPAEGEDVVVKITSDLPWFTEVVGDWISVKPNKGNSDGNIIITIAENPWNYVRTGYVYISNGIDREAIKITQVGADPILYFTKNYIPVPLKGGIKYVRLVNNTYWTTEWEIQ